ncbi:MAG: hypothetical protein LUD76_12610 [Alistipes sp.]|nr:hypothetical protein [Alistipes sp.]
METDKERQRQLRSPGKVLERSIIVCAVITLTGLVIYKEYFEAETLSLRGRYTIAEITRVNPRIGRNRHRSRACFNYNLYGEHHSGSYTHIGLNTSLAGHRYFVLVAPRETKRTRLYTDYPVPDWFTIAPPDTGWAAIPSDKELRQMVLRRNSDPDRIHVE